MAKQFWLMKTEPGEFSIADLERVRIEPWSGVRNVMARFYMRSMQIGDEVLFHHSSVEPPGVAGLARVVRTGVVDEKQFDKASPYFDPRATRDQPRWDCVDVEYVATFPHYVSMGRMRAHPGLEGMHVLKRGMRLSVQPVTEAHYALVVEMGQTAPEVPEPPPKPPKPPRPSKPHGAKPGAAKGKPRAARAKAKPAAKAKPKARASGGRTARPAAKRRTTKR